MKYHKITQSAVLPWLLITLFIFCPLKLFGQTQSTRSSIDIDELLQKHRYTTFRITNSFVVGVQLVGTAQQLGLNLQELIDFAKLRLKNNISNISILKHASYSDSTTWVILTVWTVGDDYPVAYHIQISCGPIRGGSTFDHAFLGYDSKEGIKKAIKESFDQLITPFAIAFYKGRGEF